MNVIMIVMVVVLVVSRRRRRKGRMMMGVSIIRRWWIDILVLNKRSKETVIKIFVKIQDQDKNKHKPIENQANVYSKTHPNP